MLKVCWDCIAGANRDNETTYGQRLNGHSYRAHWTSQNQANMFRLPKPINVSDVIYIQGTLTEKESIFFSLCLENQNIARQIEINFLEQCTYEHNEDGTKEQVSDIPPSDLITGPVFTLSVEVLEKDDEYMLKISIGASYLCSLFLNNISSISFINLSNNVSVKELNFRYA